MSFKESNMLLLGTKMPKFSLVNVQNKEIISIDEGESFNGILIMFICNHCPFVIHVLPEIVRIAGDYIQKGIKIIAISSNDIEKYPQDGPDKMKQFALRNNFPFPYLYDETQDVARAYSAACTPDFSIFDGDLKCVYRGQLDDSRPSNSKPVTGKDIREALDAVLAGKPVGADQKVSIGCNIKWKQKI